MSELKNKILAEVKIAMKSGDKTRLGVLRLITAAIKQREVDERIELGDADVVGVMDKMAKQRRESISQFEQAGRDDLASIEKNELEILANFLPKALSEAEIATAVDAAVAESGASSVRDMGKVMGILKPQLQGKANMSAVSALVKGKLSG